MTRSVQKLPQEVVERCHQGFSTDSSNFNEKEAMWVTYRLAELLG